MNNTTDTPEIADFVDSTSAEGKPPNPTKPAADAKAAPKRRGRPAGAPNKKAAAKPATVDGGVATHSDTEYHAAAAGAATILELAGTTIFNKDWAFTHNEISLPDGSKRIKSERAEIEQAFERYFREKGIVDLPPGYALVLTIGFYAASRVMHSDETKTQVSKITKIGLYIKDKIGKKMKTAKDAKDAKDAEKKKDDESNITDTSSEIMPDEPKV